MLEFKTWGREKKYRRRRLFAKLLCIYNKVTKYIKFYSFFIFEKRC